MGDLELVQLGEGTSSNSVRWWVDEFYALENVKPHTSSANGSKVFTEGGGTR